MSLRSRRIFFTSVHLLLLGGLAWGVMGCGNSDSEPAASKSPETKTEPKAPETPPPQNTDPKPSEPTAQIPEPSQTKPETTPEASQPPADERKLAGDPKSQLQADLADAISLLEQGDVASFIEHYMPLEYVKNIREFSTIEEMAKNIKTGGLFEKEWLQKLRAMQKGEVAFADAEKSLARFTVEIGGQEAPPSYLNVPNPAEETVPEFPGFAGDVQAAIGEAIAALEAGEHRKFIENLFPPSELYLTQSEETREGLLLRLKEHPEMVEQMLADLKALQKLTPQLDDQKTTATFQLNAGTPEERIVRFEKAGTWRLADTAKEIRTQVYKQSQQPPIAVKQTLKTEWIRIRDHWRMSRID